MRHFALNDSSLTELVQIVRLITNNPDIVEKYGFVCQQCLAAHVFTDTSHRDIVVEYIDSLTDPDVTNLILEKGDTIVPHIDAIVPLLPLVNSLVAGYCSDST